MSRSPNDRLQSKDDSIRQAKLNMAAIFVENFNFLWCIGERNDVYKDLGQSPIQSAQFLKACG